MSSNNICDRLQVGKIINTHGVRGEVKILPLTDDSQRYNDLEWVYVDTKQSLVKYDIEYIKFIGRFVIAKFRDVDDADSAGRLKGLYLMIDRDFAVNLPDDSYFICDLIGCTVYDENKNRIGYLKDVFKTGSNDVYIVENENKKEVLIPALKSVITEISVKDKRITVMLPKGLIDDEV